MVAQLHARGLEQRHSGLPQAFYLDIHLAGQGISVYVYILGLEAVESTDLFPTLQCEEGVAVTHAQGGLRGMALAVDVGYIDTDHILKRGLVAEVDTAVGFGGKGDVETAVGSSGQFTLGHNGTAFIPPPAPPPAVEPEAFNSILYARTRYGHSAVAGRHATHRTGTAKLRCLALDGLHRRHELGLLVFLHAYMRRSPVLVVCPHCQVILTCNPVGRYSET